MSSQPQNTPSLDESDSILLKSFKDALEKVAEVNDVEVESNLKSKYGDGDASSIRKYVDIWRGLSTALATLRKADEWIVSVSNWKDTAADISWYALMLKNDDFSNARAKLDCLRALEGALSNLVSKLPKLSEKRGTNHQCIVLDVYLSINLYIYTLEFKNSRISDDAAERKALQKFIETGAEIIDDPNYNSSILRQLDEILSNAESWVKDQFESSSGMKLYSADRAFVALAAPSMEGKTQSAFTLRMVKPLYFPLSEARPSGFVSQSIYVNFNAHVHELFHCSQLDLKLMGRYTLEEVTAENLELFCKKTRSWTLGFLMELVDRNSSNSSWMDFYAKRANFEFSQCSIADLPTGYFNGFCLFLDEFSSDPWAVYIRNLARLIGLRCVCSNTNTRVANLVGKNTASANQGQRIWSIVLVRLNSPCVSLLNKSFNLQGSIDYLKNASGAHSDLHRFLVDFEETQLNILRPGAAMFVAAAIGEFCRKLQSNSAVPLLGNFFDFVVTRLYTSLKIRKMSLEREYDAYMAKIGLLYPESFFPAKPGQITLEDSVPRPQRCPKYLKKNSFLEYHLYYLRNPQFEGPDVANDHINWAFFTVSSNNKVSPLGTISNESIKLWHAEYTHFEPNEIFTFLGCLFIPFHFSPMTYLNFASIKADSSKWKSLLSSPNPNARQLDGNDFEVAASVCIADASQHAYDAYLLGTNVQVRSFKGQTGTTFIQNLVSNLVIDWVELTSNNLVKVTFPESDAFNLVEKFLNCFHIPFLYSFNRNISIFKNCSDPDFFADQYFRPPNNAEIDGRFPIRFNGLPSLAVMECKNYASKVTVTKLKDILKKVNKVILEWETENKDKDIVTPKLSLIFCNSCSIPGRKSKLAELCNTAGINIYRIKKSGPRAFEVVPFFAEADRISSDPKLICIIFPIDDINSKDEINSSEIQIPPIFYDEVDSEEEEANLDEKEYVGSAVAGPIIKKSKAG